jgi:hypothetical protein
MTTTVLAHDSIALGAYYNWEAEGRPHGRHEAHWLAAEAALTAAPAPVAVEVAPASKAAPVKAPTVRKAAAPRKPAPAKAAAPTAPAETVVAAAALAAPRAARSTAKAPRRTH